MIILIFCTFINTYFLTNFTSYYALFLDKIRSFLILTHFFFHFQSDSDPDAPAARGGIMRPTIASQNRMNGGKYLMNNGGK